ncbi:glycoside hydrolase superfamily [Talaromyces proteolyticus]|uniref:Glycoside hydrolase superfamily n=1 Tax=Talaromyces proteolyticus TaxID=1131652 RepID=A0AAD4Q075_9EURO|nr:glycoside hydrolase superfamily [Talaromyces proteolyticus]KAH8696741.1 glycoside hydrolase superfamily [Talaromyces proteolyticus]
MEDDIQKEIGYLLSVGFEGTAITPQVKSLIEEYHVGTIALQAKNLQDAAQAVELIKSLQKLAYDAGYSEPLLISLDQENGGVNSIFDPDYFRQFPSAMGLAACRASDKGLTRTVSCAAAKELSCLGVNWLVGPVFDVHSDNERPQPMGVRSFGEDPEHVAEQALESMLGYRAGGLLTCTKHFPGYGNLDFLGSPSDIPIVSGTFDQLLSSSLIPFQTAINHRTDAVLVGACGMPDVKGAQVQYACLSHSVVTGLLRRRMGFDGVILSDCLEIESLYEGVGVSQAAAMAINAGCDMIMLCQSYSNQVEAIRGISTAVKSGLISRIHIKSASNRVRQMKIGHLSWERVWNPGGLARLDALKSAHKTLSRTAYEASITLVRDFGNNIPLQNDVHPEEVLLLLTPLVEPFRPERLPDMADISQASASPRPINIARHYNNREGHSYLEGETTFHALGVSIAKRWRGKVVHTSYTASGISPLHEKLVSEAAAVILLTADGVRNVYQYGFTKYIVSLCQSQYQIQSSPQRISSGGKPCIVVAASSPYDFMKDKQVPTYVCTYDLTRPPMEALVRVLFGKLKAVGLPPTARQLRSRSTLHRQLWLVEKLQPNRDKHALQDLFDQVRMAASNTFSDPEAQYPAYCFEVSSYFTTYEPLIKSEHFVVRNSSTHKVYGFCATHYIETLARGCIASIVVSSDHRGRGIGYSLHQHAMGYLQRLPGIEIVQFGSELPAIFAGIPNRLSTNQLSLRGWVKNRGWDVGNWNHHEFHAIRLLRDWKATTSPEKIASSHGFKYDPICARDEDELNHHLLMGTGFGVANSALRHPVIITDLYRRARADIQGCKIVLARDIRNNKIIGSIILYHSSSQINPFFPVHDKQTGGLAGIVVSSNSQAASVVHGLVAKSATVLVEIGFLSAQIFIVRSFFFLSCFISSYTDNTGGRLRIPCDFGKYWLSTGIGVS